MILRSIDLEAFGRFSRRCFEFRRGLNLVLGPNEAGKSTLMEAVPAILFGVRDKKRYLPWGRGGACRGALQFELDGGSVRVQRDLMTDEVGLEWADQLYQTRRQVSGKASPRGRSLEKKAYLLELQELLGFRDADLFRATLFFGQGDLDLDFGKSLSERIKTLLSGSAEIDYDQVLDDLRETLFSVTRENPWGKDKTRDRQLELAEKELARLDGLLQQSVAARKEFSTIEAELLDLETGLAEDQRELDKGEKYLQWIRTYWQLEEQRSHLEEQFSITREQQAKQRQLTQKRETLRRQLSAVGLSLPEDGSVDLHERLQEARRCLLQLRQLQQEQQRLRQDLADEKKSSMFFICGWTLLVILGAGFGAWHVQPWRIYFLLSGVLLTGPVWVWTIRRRVSRSVRHSELRGKAQLLEQQQHELQRQLDLLEEPLAAAGLAVRLDVLDAQLDAWAGHREKLQALREIDSALKVLPTAEELAGTVRRLTRDLALVEERRQQGRNLRPGVDLEAAELADAEAELEQLRRKIVDAEERRNRLWMRRAECGALLAGWPQLEEDRAEVLQDVVRLQGRKRVLSLACEVLRDSVSHFRADYLERFAARIGPYLESASDGVYREARLAEDLSISLRGEGGRWKPLPHFSRGTRDAVALAVRLAFVDQFSHGRKLPILLDDALVNLDGNRQARMLKLLKKLSLDHQVILFSHDEWLAKRAARERWHVLTLDDGSRAPARSIKEEQNAGQLHLL
ncbi:hypothetical protein C2E25_03405 [Geothermobacter hydrogeniphilus]|uniref:YhaN AAA domain-containing protein n=1 Tax=Geothermobacter hydrogeniphilus TaxID=1969733 RepID=A0A2K2HCZ0_9BACT|nr:AAA family ATPase [Geothermobacter hydrogeniphilus]PNU21091.1 hypothetical protein C2E25_03405 [Geothermobacter hydrogeniphilus]